MITEEQLKKIMLNNYELKDIERIFSKKLKTVYNRGNAKNISNIIEISKKFNVELLLIKCPTILVTGKSSEIKSILELLEEKKLLDLIKECPYILAKGKSSEIIDGLKRIENINGDINNVTGGLLLNYDKICDIVELNSDVSDDEYLKNIKLNLMLRGEYNKIYKKDELLHLKNILNVKYDDLLRAVFPYINDTNQINEIIKKQGYVFIGDSIPIRNSDFKLFSTEIIGTVEKVSKSMISKYKKLNYDDVYDFALETVMNKCGGMFINFGKTQSLYPILFTYLKKSCLKLIGTQELIMKDKILNKKEYAYYQSYDNEACFIKKYFYLSTDEQVFLQRISNCIELGCDYMEFLQFEFGMTQKEVLEKITIIREKISEYTKGR